MHDGRVVKGINFVNLRDAGDPVEQASFYDREGADELVFLDISASAEGRKTMVDVVRETARQGFEAAGMVPGEADISLVPANSVAVDAETGAKIIRLMEALEDNDDVQKVHSNFDLPDDVLAQMG